jgi:hypothetical protein
LPLAQILLPKLLPLIKPGSGQAFNPFAKTFRETSIYRTEAGPVPPAIIVTIRAKVSPTGIRKVL